MKGMTTGRWIAAVFGVMTAYALVHSWPEIHRYLRIRAM